jgi:hypothetical protein
MGRRLSHIPTAIIPPSSYYVFTRWQLLLRHGGDDKLATPTPLSSRRLTMELAKDAIGVRRQRGDLATAMIPSPSCSPRSSLHEERTRRPLLVQRGGDRKGYSVLLTGRHHDERERDVLGLLPPSSLACSHVRDMKDGSGACQRCCPVRHQRCVCFPSLI